MTSARRACAYLLGTAVTVAAVVMGLPAPQQRAHGSAVGSATGWPGGPMLSAQSPRRPGPARPAPGGATVAATDSLNWAGYAVSGHHERFAAVRATFFVPYLSCSETHGKTLASAWVGLDGFAGKPDSVEQAGIAADCTSTGKASYYAWWEMFPDPETRASVAVKPGDAITVSVGYDTAHRHFRLWLTDTTSGGRFAVSRRCPDAAIRGHRVRCPRTSAEVVTEAPATTAGSRVILAHLSDYGAVSFSAVTITDAARHRGNLVSGRWDTTEVIQLKPSSTAVVAQPTSAQPSAFDTYWLRPN